MPPRDHAFELIPGEHYIFVDASTGAELPGDAAVEDLASLALRMRAQPTLSVELLVTTVSVAEGVLAVLAASAAIAATFTSAGRWLDKLRAAKRDDATPSLPVHETVTRVLTRTPGLPAGAIPGAVASASTTKAADGGTYVSLEVGRHHATVYISPEGAVSEVILRELAERRTA